jgi:hypothetical protein
MHVKNVQSGEKSWSDTNPLADLEVGCYRSWITLSLKKKCLKELNKLILRVCLNPPSFQNILGPSLRISQILVMYISFDIVKTFKFICWNIHTYCLLTRKDWQQDDTSSFMFLTQGGCNTPDWDLNPILLNLYRLGNLTPDDRTVLTAKIVFRFEDIKGVTLLWKITQLKST